MSTKFSLGNVNNAELVITNPDTNFNGRAIDISKVAHQVDTITDLRAMTEKPDTVYVTGYHTAGDGAFGSHFFKRVDSAGTDNTGTIIVPNGVTTYYYALQYDGAVNVKWFGAAGDGVTDDTTAIQAAIDYCVNFSANDIFCDPGVFIISSSLTVGGYIKFSGSGNSQFATSNYTSLVQRGTIFRLITKDISLFLPNSNCKFNNFSCINYSGGVNENCFYSLGLGFSNFENITIGGFNYGFNFEKSLYITFSKLVLRGNNYGISCWQNTGTSPYTLNSTYYNNIISIKDSQVNYSNIGIRVCGVNIYLNNIDCSINTTYGIQIGGSSFPTNSATIDSFYSEGTTGTPIYIENSSINAGTILLAGSNTDGIVAKNSRVTVSSISSYGTITNGINNDNSNVQLIGKLSGHIGKAFVNSNGGVTKQLYKEIPTITTYSLAAGVSNVVPVGSYSLRTYEFKIYGSNNGNPFMIGGIINNGISIIGNVPTNLSVTASLNSNGTYDLKTSNTATSAYGFTFTVVVKPLYYTAPLA